MVPRESRGHSFKGAALYYLHDKERDTDERIEWTHSDNLCADDPERAIREMTLTYYDREHLKNAAGVRPGGRRLEWSVYTLSLSWHPEENPDKEHMIETGRSALKTIGLEDHQVLYVCHNDTEHQHVHMIVNRVHPETGLSQNLWASERKLSRWAERYEREYSQKIYCEDRVKNNQDRDQGQHVIYRDNLIRDAWQRSDSGRAFSAALDEQGWILARGNRRDTYVAVAPNGRQIGLRNELNKGVSKEERITTKDLRARFSDIDFYALPDADRASVRQKERHRQALKEQQTANTQSVLRPTHAFNQTAQSQNSALATKKNTDKRKASGEPTIPAVLPAASSETWDRDQYDRDWEDQLVEAAIVQTDIEPERPIDRTRSALQAIEEHDRNDIDRCMAREEVRSAMSRAGRLQGRKKLYLEKNEALDRQFDEVFREGGKARQRFYAYESRHGFRKAVQRLQDRPQTFGRFNGSGLGFWRSASRKEAQKGIPSLAQNLIGYQGLKKRTQNERRERERAAKDVREAKARQQTIENDPGSERRQALLRDLNRNAKGLSQEDFASLNRRERWQLMQAREHSTLWVQQQEDARRKAKEAQKQSTLQQEFEERRQKMIEQNEQRDDIAQLEEEHRRRQSGPGLRR